MNTKLTVLSKSIKEEFNLMVGDLMSARRHKTNIGEFLVKAKELCNHGEWRPFIKELPFNRDQAQKYLVIGNNASLYLESDDTINEFYEIHAKKKRKPQPNNYLSSHLTTEDKEPKLEPKVEPKVKLKPKPKPVIDDWGVVESEFESEPRFKPNFFIDDEEETHEPYVASEETKRKLLDLMGHDDSLIDLLNEAGPELTKKVFMVIRGYLHPDRNTGNPQLFDRAIKLEESMK